MGVQRQRRADGRPVIDVYARLSQAVDGSTIKVDDQVEVCVETVERRGAVLGEAFRDNSLSAWKPGVVRPQWNELMSRLESGASDGVIVYDLTRFSRKVLEGERLVELAASGLRVWALAGEYDLATADGRRAFRESMVAAAAESDKISERVKRGKLRRARRGRVHGGARAFGMPGWAPPPPGWASGDPRREVPAAVVEAEREVIRECYRRLLAGGTVSGLVWDLNRREVSNGQGNRWARHTLTRMLARPAVAGLSVHRGEVVGVLAGVEPVVSREEWERLRGVLDGRKRGRPAGRVHLLSGLMRCGGCGRPLTGVPRRGMTPYADGSPKREYRCRRDPGYPGCGRNHIDALVAELAVAEAVKTRLGDPRRAERIARRLMEVRDERADIDGEIARLSESADSLAGKVASWGVDRVDAAMQPILRRVEELRGALAAVDTATDDTAAAAADAVAAWDEAAARGDIDTLRAMVRRAFPRLTLRQPSKRIDADPARLDWDATATTTGAAPSLTPDPNQTLTAALAAAGEHGVTVAGLIEETGMSSSWVYERLRRHANAGTAARAQTPAHWRLIQPAAECS